MNFHYYRVSTDSQSIEMQVNAMGKYPKDRKFTDFGVSGKSMDRPSFVAMVEQLRGGDTVYCYSLSRIGRNTVELIEFSNKLDKMGVSLVSHVESLDTSSPIGRFFFTMMSALAQFERENTEERRIQGIKTAREKGTKFGRRPRLTEEQALFIKSSDLPLQELANRYGVSLSTVKRAKK